MPELPFRGSGGSAIFVCQSPTPGGRAAIDDVGTGRWVNERVNPQRPQVPLKLYMERMSATRHSAIERQVGSMSAMGHKRTFCEVESMSALPPKADMCSANTDGRFGPKADIRPSMHSA